jgi:cell division protein FtsI/penicillin-binding protein 2
MAYQHNVENGIGSWRIKALRFFFLLLIVGICVRLFVLQVVEASWYQTWSQSQHEISEELVATRGSVYVQDYGDETEYAVATNESRAVVFANPSLIKEPINTGLAIAKILQLAGWDIYGVVAPVVVVDPAEIPLSVELTETEKLITRLSKIDDPYEPVARDVKQAQLDAILALQAPGIDYVLRDARTYPEKNFGGQMLGFLGQKDDGSRLGMYGLEGFWNDFLAGRTGSSYAQGDAAGNWTGVGARKVMPAVDGGDLLLTIDRTAQYIACKMLREGVDQFQADSGSLVIVEPSTGRILVMCGAPDFDPNNYGNVSNAVDYNNQAIFEPYEPGSVFKPLVMAAAIDIGAVSPNTTFNDSGEVKVDDYTIRNSDLKAHGLVTMTDVLDESLNTGMVWVMKKMGRDTMENYIKKFHFGALGGVELATEAAGTIAALDEQAEVYAATASFGQGITVTPLQLASAYAAVANGGALMKPYVVEEVRYTDGTVDKRKAEKVEQVLTPATATTVGAMLVSVVENGHGKRAGVKGYYIAGKTGTAQVAGNGSYLAGVTNGTFAGFGPVNDPKFAMVIKLNNPKTVEWAESSAAPIFGQIAGFLLDYYDIAPTRSLE